MTTIPKITLDNNCVINLFDHKSRTTTSVDALTEIVKYAFSGRVDVAITTRVETDLENDSDDERRNDMMQKVKLFPVIGSVIRLGVSQFGSEDVFGGSGSERMFDELQKIIFPGLDKSSRTYGNKINDIDHLVGHFINNRDIFVTDDKGILKKRKVLEVSPGITVMSPEDCKSYLDEIETLSEKRCLENSSTPTGYSSSAYSGKVTFDYSNNNGIYALGKGFNFFETKWSKASDASINVYNDPLSIDGIALAKDVKEIEEVSDAGAYDFSSRVRTVRKSGVVIFRNKNNVYAALKIIDIKDDSRRDKSDEITFEFEIIKSGSSFVK